MNTKSIFAATLLSFCAVSGAAWAADTQAGADMTRDEVIAAMKDAEARGLISHGELDYPPAVTLQSNKTREEVQAEFAAARAAGQISEGELGYPTVTASQPGKTRAQVRAELREYLASGHAPHIEA
jgi:hypothetical protein